MALTLDDFVRAASPLCTVCALPEGVLAQIREGRALDRRAFTYARISAWLRTVEDDGPHQVSEDSLRRHFKNHEARA